jgi:Penicillin binding protein transpeptidase domain/Penicillin-binding Protein dimerisation domain
VRGVIGGTGFRRSTRRPGRLRPRGAVIAVAAVVLLAGAGVAVRQLRGSRASPAGAAAGLAAALSRDRLTGVRFANARVAPVAASWRSIRAGMGGAGVSVTLAAATARGDVAVARLRWLWQLPLGRRWAYETDASLRYEGGGWRPVWSPRLVHRRLRAGDRLQLTVPQPARAPIVAADERPIVQARPVVNVGIEPNRVHNLALLVRQLHAYLGVDSAPLARAVRAATPTAFVPVITLRRADYERLKPRIYPLPDTVFVAGTLPLAPTRAFARSLLGVTGPATAAIVRASRGRIAPGEIVGLSGLELAFDRRLAGSPGLAVDAVPSRVQRGAVRLYSVAAGPPAGPLSTTLEVRAQEAADAALAGVRQPSALVAIRISSGNVVAVSVGPDPGGYDTALEGEYPPGSTFKVVTTLALLERGLRPDDTVDCPPLLTVDGKIFHNAEHEISGPVSFAQDFAHSCNTAFAGLAARVAGDALPATALALGIGRDPALGVPNFAGSVPAPRNPVELAASAFGQGRVLVSPLALAAAAAAVARGRWLPPRLVLVPRLPTPPPGPPLPAGPVATLRTLMRAVVTGGTGTALAGQPGPPVYGKTGTAEIGTGTIPRTDAWFIGYQGDIAFAVLVASTQNGFGGVLAAPIAGRFLARAGVG